LDAARWFEDVLMCSEPIPVDTLAEVGRELAAAQASLKSAEAFCAAMENKIFSEQCARANAETCAQQFSADRDAAHKEIKLVKSREASLNAQISEMNAIIKSHQEMYDRLENPMQLAHHSNELLTKEVNHDRSEYLVEIQAFKKSHENLHKLLFVTDPTETTLTLKLRERNLDLVRRVKRLEKAYSALGSRLRLQDMDPEALILMVEGLELDKIDWETMAPDPQTRRYLQAVYKLGLSDGGDRDSLADDIARAKVRFADLRAEKLRKAEEAAAAAGLPAPSPLTVSVRRPSAPSTQDPSTTTNSSPVPGVPQYSGVAPAPLPSSSRSLSITWTGPPVVATGAERVSSSAPSSTTPAGHAQSLPAYPAHSPPVWTPPAPVSSGKKARASPSDSAPAAMTRMWISVAVTLVRTLLKRAVSVRQLPL
ncbi:hypothetical protein PHMEG_00029413, partial [Phytophthora megakarya]